MSHHLSTTRLVRAARPSHVRQSLLVLLLTTAVAGCPQRVVIPRADQDHVPVITVNSFVVGGSGTVSQSNVTSAQTLSVSLGTELMLSAHAHSPGGVKTLSMVLTQGQRTVTATTSDAADASGKGIDQLDILGSDGMGHSGNQPIMLLETPAGAPIPGPASLTVMATNFNGGATTFVVTYQPTWTAPTINSFVAAPDYINIGSSSTLSWKITGCSAYCQVRVEGRDADGLVESFPARQAFGSVLVRPDRRTVTSYTLTASNPLGLNTQPKTITVTLAPQAVTGQGKTFFFKVNGGSGVTPCFTLAIYAPDAATAASLAEAQNGGYDATAITEAEYLSGCTFT